MNYLTPDDIAERCSWAKPTGVGWQAVCPVHEDKSPSLSISEGNRATLIYCHAGCSFDDLAAELGFERQQLFHDYDPHARSHDSNLGQVMAEMIRDARPKVDPCFLRFSDIMYEALGDGDPLWVEGQALAGLEFPHVADLHYLDAIELPKLSLDVCMHSFLSPWLKSRGYKDSPFEARRAAWRTIRHHWRENYG